jgi:hypothetical protein
MTKKRTSYFYAIWCKDERNIKLLTGAIQKHKKKYAVIENTDSISAEKKVIVFAEEDLLSNTFFEDNKDITKKIDDLSWKFIIIGTKQKIKPFPYMAKRMDKKLEDENQISLLILNIDKSSKKNKKSKNILNKKLSRLIFIYQTLYETEKISFDDIKKVSNISNRTFLRDIQTLNEALLVQTITKKGIIEFYNEDKCYRFKYL